MTDTPGDAAPGETGTGPDDQAPSTPTLEELTDQVQQVAAVVVAHENALVAIKEELEGRPDGPWAWRFLAPEKAHELWEELFDWVNWLDERYLRYLGGEKLRLVDGWFLHPVAVELLTALMVSHKAAYRKRQSAPSTALADWHEKYLFPTFDRMRGLNLFPQKADQPGWEGPATIRLHRDGDRFAAFLARFDKEAQAAETERVAAEQEAKRRRTADTLRDRRRQDDTGEMHVDPTTGVVIE